MREETRKTITVDTAVKGRRRVHGFTSITIDIASVVVHPSSFYFYHLPPSFISNISFFAFSCLSRDSFLSEKEMYIYIYIINYGTPLMLTDDYSLWWYARWWYSFDIIRLTWKK